MNSLTIDNLPDEILFEIFKLFHLKERNIARLVSKRWNDVLLLRSFTDTEIFYVDHGCGFSTAGQLLKECRRPTVNLRIVQLDFRIRLETIPIDFQKFLKIWGYRIECLHLLWCDLTPEILKQIFTSCVNLKEFSAEKCTGELDNTFCKSKHGLGSISFLDNLVRENLTKFYSDPVYSRHFSIKNFDVLATAFPKIEILEIRKILPIGDEVKPMLLNALYKMKCLKSCVIELDSNTEDWKKFSDIDWKGSKPIRMTLTDDILSRENRSTILSNKYWTSLQILKINSHSDSNETFIAGLLTGLPHLQKFDISLSDVPNMQTIKTLLPAMVHSNLKSIKFYTRAENINIDEVNDAFSLLESFAVVNNSVRYLRIQYNADEEDDKLLFQHLNSFFFKHFLAVRDLDVAAEVQIATAFKYQKHLEFVKFDAFSTAEFGNKLEMSTVPSLIGLRLRFEGASASPRTFFSTYRFPNLKYLSLSIENNFYHYNSGSVRNTKPILSSISSNCPELEVFDVYSDCGYGEWYPHIEIVKFYQQLQQLRCASLIFRQGFTLPKELKYKLMEQCPLLRILRFGTGYRYFTIKNLITKELSHHPEYVRRARCQNMPIYTHSRMILGEGGSIY